MPVRGISGLTLSLYGISMGTHEQKESIYLSLCL